MKFVVTAKHRYWRQVIVRVPSTEADGKVDQFDLRLRFEAPSREMLREIANRGATPDQDVVKEMVTKVVIGWDGPVDGDGNAVAFSGETLEAALDNPWFGPAVYREFLASMNTDLKSGN